MTMYGGNGGNGREGRWRRNGERTCEYGGYGARGGTGCGNGFPEGGAGYASSAHGGRRPLYRARDGRFMGVCKGLARYFDVRVRYVRLAFILAAVFSAFWPVLAVYIFLGLIMKPEPVLMPQDEGERDFYSAYVGSRAEAVSRLREKFGSLETRIRRMESVVTSREFDWERRFRDR